MGHLIFMGHFSWWNIFMMYQLLFQTFYIQGVSPFDPSGLVSGKATAGSPGAGAFISILPFH